MKRNRGNFEKTQKELLNLIERTKVGAPKSEANYIATSKRFAVDYVNKLSKLLDRMDNTGDKDELVKLSDDIYNIIAETNLKHLDKAKDDYDYFTTMLDRISNS